MIASPSTTPAAVEAFTYLVELINADHVAPPASETNDNGDFSRNQFLAGKMALFQSGTYNLAAIAGQANFHWGVAMMPAGPKGRVSVTNGIAAAGNSASPHPDAVRQVLAWMGSTEGNQYLGRQGSAIPAVTAAQQVYFDYWLSKGVDVKPFFDGARRPADRRSGRRRLRRRVIRSSSRISTRCSWAVAISRQRLRRAQDAANAAARR